MADAMLNPSVDPPALDPPFRGFIETTYDSLLVFEAARRGMIPRVTRRLIERERGMVQSGAVFVFDEQESGIKRWTDGLIWSPSRILGNFLVYRETDKRSGNSAASSANSSANSSLSSTNRSNSPRDSPSGANGISTGTSYSSTSGMQMRETTEVSMGNMHEAADSTGDLPILAQGAIRPRSGSEGGMDRQRERQLVGSLTNSYNFKTGGLVKKTMSVTVHGYSQHMISYYSIEDVMAGRLRVPSTIPELAALEISPEYLQRQHFRFPPQVELGPDGVPRYRRDQEEPNSPNPPPSGLSYQSSMSADQYDPYNQLLPTDPPRQHQRAMTQPTPIPQYTSTGHWPSSSYFDPTGRSSELGTQAIPIQRQVSAGAMRPGSATRRYDPYSSSGSPRISSGSSLGSHGMGISPNQFGSMGRRQSVPVHHQHQLAHQDYYGPPIGHGGGAGPSSAGHGGYDVKPTINPLTGQPSYDQYSSSSYNVPSTAPSHYGYYGNASSSGSGAQGELPSPAAPYAPSSAPIPSSSSHPLNQASSNTGVSGPSWHTSQSGGTPLTATLPLNPVSTSSTPTTAESQSRLIPRDTRTVSHDFAFPSGSTANAGHGQSQIQDEGSLSSHWDQSRGYQSGWQSQAGI